MKALCITHVPFEGPARIGDWARERGHELCVVRSDLKELPSSLDEYGGVVVMGGPMSANDEYRWLANEMALLESALRRDMPLLGVCLGAQLLAKVLGAKVLRAAHKEIGWWPIHSSADAHGQDLALPAGLVPFHWHGETFELPIGARRLGSSIAIENQAFLFQRRVLGLQFHVEASEESVRALVQEASDDITEGPWVQSAAAMLADSRARCTSLAPECYSVLDELFEGVA